MESLCPRSEERLVLVILLRLRGVHLVDRVDMRPIFGIVIAGLLRHLLQLHLLLLLLGGNHVVDCVAEAEKVYEKLVYRDRERPLCHPAASHGIIGEPLGRPAPVADVPGDGARARRVVIVRSHLAVDADGVHDGHGEAEEDADDGGPDPHDEGDELGEQDEEGEDRDADVVVGEVERPDEGHVRGRHVVRLGVEDDAGARVEAPDVADAPELRAEQVWLGDGEEDQQGHGAGQLGGHNQEHGRSLPPLSDKGLVAPVPLWVPHLESSLNRDGDVWCLGVGNSGKIRCLLHTGVAPDLISLPP